MNKIQNSFNDMMSTVANDLMRYNSPICLAFSGGIDSCAIAIAFKKTDKDFFLLHIENQDVVDEGGYNKLFEHYVSWEFSQLLRIPIIFVYRSGGKSLDSLINLYKRLNIASFVTGDGMDRCYGTFGKSIGGWDATLGEDFHSFHPLIDKLLVTIPRRVPFKNNYSGIDDDHINYITKCTELGLDVIHFCLHPEFTEFFLKYKTSFKDVVYPKLLTFNYVDCSLTGYHSYYDFCKKVYKKYKNILHYPFERFLMKYDKNKD